MDSKEIDRKIAVIFATDVVGYSKSVEINEEQTIKNFRACKAILENLFREHDGRIFNTAGDSVLAEFSSAVSAVICAAEFQKLIKERNASETADQKMEFRVGINMGDVVVEGDNLYGDGVNIAARLEALAQPNGICLSKAVHDFINKKIDFLFNDLGEQIVKDNQFHAFDVVIDDSHKRKLKTKSKSKAPLFAAIATVLVLVTGGLSYYNFFAKNTGQENGKLVVSSDRPTILVMPFANQSGNKEQNYIGMGMTSHLITTLSQFDQLLVFAKSTGEFILENKISNEEIVKQYGIQYVLNGTTQAAGNKVRVNVELANIAKKTVIWSEVYDFTENNIFDIQDQVGNSVLGHLGLEVISGSATASRRFKNPEMLKNNIMGLAAYQSWTVEGMQKAEKLWSMNYKLDPENPYSITGIGWLLHGKVLMGMSNDPQGDLDKAHKLALGVLEKYPDHVIAMQLAATIEATIGEFDSACGRIEKMAKLAREVSEIVMTAETQRQCGHYPASIKNWQRAFEISPHYSSWIRIYYLYTLLQNGDLGIAKQYALDQSTKDHLYYGANEALLAMLAYIAYKEGDEHKAKDYFEKQNSMKSSMTKAYIENYDFPSVRSRVFVTDYVRILQSLGMPDE